MKEYNVNNHIICKKVELIRILGLSIFFRSKYKQIIKSKLVLFLLFREKLKLFFLQERERERERERNKPQSDS